MRAASRTSVVDHRSVCGATVVDHLPRHAEEGGRSPDGGGTDRDRRGGESVDGRGNRQQIEVDEEGNQWMVGMAVEQQIEVDEEGNQWMVGGTDRDRRGG